MLSEYRQRFSDYHSHLSREEYLYRSGRRDRSDWGAIFSDYADLFEYSAIAELRAKFEQTPQGFETEKVAIRRLIAFAVEGNLFSRLAEISAEMENLERKALIAWDGKSIDLNQAGELIACESDYNRRRDLYARMADVIDRSRGLRIERAEKIRDAAKELQFDDFVAMKAQLRGVEIEKVAAQAEKLLSATEIDYVKSFSILIGREHLLSIDDATGADLPYLQQYRKYDHFFAKDKLLGIYGDLFAGLGFLTGKQTNLKIETTSADEASDKTGCFPIRVPDEIKLIVALRGGQEGYRDLLREAGRAQNYAWTSKNIYPEFQIGGDSATPLAWGMLLENLMLDGSWLREVFGFTENHGFRRDLSVFRLLNVRRQAAQLSFEAQFFRGLPIDNAGALYSEILTAGLRAKIDEVRYPVELSDDFFPAIYLRAAAFEAQMRDFLKTRFGVNWRNSRKAGETLIDLWNTGRRYSVEELAKLIGLGELDYDWLAEDLITEK